MIFIGMVTLNMIAMIGMEAVAVLITVLVKNTGIVAALSCVYFFAGAITYPMVYENFQNQSVLLKAFCVMNPTTYMYNICGYRMTNGIVVGTIMYGMGACLVGIVFNAFCIETSRTLICVSSSSYYFEINKYFTGGYCNEVD